MFSQRLCPVFDRPMRSSKTGLKDELAYRLMELAGFSPDLATAAAFFSLQDMSSWVSDRACFLGAYHLGNAERPITLGQISTIGQGAVPLAGRFSLCRPRGCCFPSTWYDKPAVWSPQKDGCNSTFWYHLRCTDWLPASVRHVRRSIIVEVGIVSKVSEPTTARHFIGRPERLLRF
ncbi:hypothetical protein LX36DRAFT_371599 [Colletotrichum falcatum]|nr:hypothetical protein LX36DRAFT_371599 [Colletotrichum falcatum]